MLNWLVRKKKWTSLALAVLMLLGSLLPQSVLPTVKAAAAHVVINQIYGAGGNSGASYKNDFIELYNPTGIEVDLNGWSVQYASSAGTTWAVTNLTKKIPAYGYYLVSEAGGTNGTALPSPDDSGTIPMAANNGKVVLVSSTDAITGGALPADYSASHIIDYVGYGTATAFEGTGPTPAPDTLNSVQRKGYGQDTNYNNNDFTKVAVNPRNTSSPIAIPDLSSDPIPQNILFTNQSGTGAVTGYAGTVTGSTYISLYTTNPSLGGTVVKAVYAGSDGDFTLSFPNPQNNTTVYVTSTETGKEESNGVTIVAATASAVVNTNAIGFLIDGSGKGSITGSAGAAAANARVYFYKSADTSVGNRFLSSTDGKDYVRSDGNGAFAFNMDNATSDVYISQVSTSANGEKLEGNAEKVTKADTSVITPISSLHTNDSNGKSDKIGQIFTIKGVVTVDNNVVGSNSFYVQDATGGINVFGAMPGGVTVAKGDLITVTGAVAFYNGLTEIVPSNVVKSGTAAMPPAVDTTIADLNVFARAELLEGKLAKITGKITNIPAASGGGYNITFADEAGKTTTLRVMTVTEIDVVTFLQKDHTYTVTGILSQYDSSSPYTSGYQIFPRNAADIQEIKLVILNHDAMTQAYTSTDIKFKATAQNADSVIVHYRATGGSTFLPLPMTTTDQMAYSAVLTAANVPAGSSFEYYIEAKTGTDTKQAGSPSAPYSVQVVADTFAPKFYGELPINGIMTEDIRPNISVQFDEPSGLDISTLKVLLDGNDVTGQVTPSADNLQLQLNADLAVTDHTISISVKDLKGNAATYSWTFKIIPVFTGGNHYRGTTHNHTNISHDGAGSPEAALQAAKKYKYDYFAFTDHSHDIDAAQVGQDTVDHKGQPERTGGSDWALTKQLANQYTKNNEFVVFPAFEMTATTWGHSNVFGTNNFIDRKQNSGQYQDLNKYYAWVMTYDDVVAQFNHPDMSANAFNNFMPYDANVDKLFTMLEVGNGSGHYAYYNAEKKFYSALDLGWHVTPTFGEDNHDGTWGQTMRRTVIVSSDLSQESLLHSMRNRRVYMTEDPNFTLDVLANGQYMGATVKGKTLNFSISGKDDVTEVNTLPEYNYLPSNYKSDDRVAKVELLTNGGKVVDSYSPMTTSFTWNPTYTVPGGQQWFVVKVTQKDGEQIYSAPIWSEVASTDVKISGVNVAGDSLTATIPAVLQAGISNLGTQDVANLNVRFYYDVADADHLIGQTVVPSIVSKGTATASVTWNNPVSGNHTLIAVIDGPIGDSTGDNTFSIPVVIKNPLGIKIMLDASHQNENTTKDTGTYKDSLKAITKQLQQEGYTVVENTSSLATPSTLAGVNVLVLTYPTISLTDDENTAVDTFIKGGGSLLLTGKSNNSANPAKNNDLLTKIGSSIQINNDGIFDLSADGNFWSTPATSPFAVRLHPGLVRNYMTDRVLTVEYYSGASLEKAGHQPLVDTDTITVLAKGNETTYQNNITAGGYIYDNVSDNTGGSAIPAIASEQLGNGRIVVSGMNFFNDKQMDEAFNPKGNNELALNIINWLAHRDTVVSSIDAARTKEDGTSVVVEGTVTTAAGVFFDAFYIQDETGGIMAYKEAPEGSLKLGDKVRVYGQMKTFENNKELDFGSFELDVIKTGQSDPIQPKQLTTGQASSESNQGFLVKVKGTIISKPDENSFVVNDGSGPILIFTDGYIANQSGPVPDLKIGDTLEATGMAGKYSEGIRIRVRNTKELIGNPSTGNGNIKVQILGVNDLHGNIDSKFNEKDSGINRDLDGDGKKDKDLGGMQFLATHIKAKRESNPNTLVVHSGDMVGASPPLSALFYDEPTIKVLNEIRFDVGAVGNHEFDDGTNELIRLAHGGVNPGGKEYEGMNFPILGANVRYKANNKHVFDPYVVKEIGGAKIGFIGVVTEETPSIVIPTGIQDLKFTNAVEEVNAAVKELKAQGVRAIVVLAHMSADLNANGQLVGEAVNLANGIDDEVDAIFAAHNHKEVKGTVNNKLVISAWEYSKALMDVDLEISRETGDVVSKSAEILYNLRTVDADAKVQSIIDEYKALAGPKLQEVVGQNLNEMTKDYPGKGIGKNSDFALGNMIADAMKAEMKADFAMMNGGGVRDNLNVGEITWEELFKIQPFNNTLMKVEVTGAEMKGIVEAQLGTGSTFGPDSHVGGFRYSWAQVGSTRKVIAITLPDGTPLDPSKMYSLVVNSFMYTSNDARYIQMHTLGKNPVQGPEDLPATVNFVKNHVGPINYVSEGRIREIAAPDAVLPVWPSGKSLTEAGRTTNSIALAWTQATDNVAVTGYKVYNGSNLVTTVTGSTYSFTVGGLTPRTNYVFKVEAIDAAGNATIDGPSLEVNTLATSNSGHGSSPSPGAGTGTGSPSQAGTADPVSTPNGVVLKPNEAELKKEIAADGKTVTKFIVNPESFANTLKLSSGNDTVKTIIINMSNVQGTVKVELPFNALKEAAGDAKNTIIRVETENKSYNLPLSIINAGALATALGTSADKINITVTIEAVTGAEAQQINTAASQPGMKLLSDGVSFTITAEANGKTTEVNDFGTTYVVRTITINEPINSNEATAVVFDPATKEMTFVPAVFEKADGKTVVQIKRNSNSTYTVVKLEKTFADLKGHWSQKDVELLASKLVVKGQTDTQFGPDSDITRAEFAALLVRALGLKVDGSAKASIKDIKDGEWYVGVLGTAMKASLMEGFEDGTFRPNAKITREQMAVMISRAMAAAGKVGDSKKTDVTAKFADGTQIHDWATDAVAKNTAAGIIQGTSENKFMPAQFATRAEATVMLKRLLEFTEFINK
ncbi:hypothetical protein GC093_04265 [Paenibacillus sp. LMG 31456]|uniref:LTD domain-containing protein n=1 Tax=Paenibacillus foliorum TaxID=2654974 RepID=A0A972GLX6_9BACL|nr:5'-nucleotidase C-terminal domain-containing protein [Paenibacillus foliorum]NOU92450.1 hypothetical protein [Paenibacillus foliorum]